jgi:L-threonylcarbamoyladenylate synthase
MVTIISHCTLETLRDAAKALREGRLVVLPTETVYGLGGDAENEEAVRRIYEVKGRPLDHPVIVHIGDLKFLDTWISDLRDYAVELARNFWPGSMTLVLPRSDRAKDFITGGQESVGVRIPAHPISLQLLTEFHGLGGVGVAAPSANRFGEVSPTTASDAEQDLGGYLHNGDLILDGGPCLVGIESTIIDCRGSQPRILRPGAITEAMITDVTELDVVDSETSLRVSGVLESHYAPRARVVVGDFVVHGGGFIAMTGIPTPPGLTRIFSPATVEEFARGLYGALREVDLLNLQEVTIIPPPGEGLARAVCDRIEKARTK